MDFTRRGFLTGAMGAALFSSLPAAAEALGNRSVRAIKIHSVNRGEKTEVAYWRNGRYDADGLRKLRWVFRDWRNGQQHHMDPKLYDIIFSLQEGLGEDHFDLISGYRSPATNAMLRRRSSGVAKNSLHLRGLAADLRPNRNSLSTMRSHARSLRAGGVGYYPSSNFVHVDTGRVRSW